MVFCFISMVTARKPACRACRRSTVVFTIISLLLFLFALLVLLVFFFVAVRGTLAGPTSKYNDLHYCESEASPRQITILQCVVISHSLALNPCLSSSTVLQSSSSSSSSSGLASAWVRTFDNTRNPYAACLVELLLRLKIAFGTRYLLADVDTTNRLVTAGIVVILHYC